MQIFVQPPRLPSALRAKWRRVLVLAVIAATAAACSNPTSDAGTTDSTDGTLSLLAFTTSQPAWTASLPAFAATAEGKGITVKPTYGPSSDLTRSVIDGTPADVVFVSDEPNVGRLVSRGMVSSDWNSGQFSGRPFGSVITLVVRKGNPKNIGDWPDLLAPGVEVVAANPVHSGSGKWGLMAAYAAASRGNQDPQAGVDYMTSLILEHVRVGPTTVSEATEAFVNGTGDVLIAPENGAIDVQRRHPDVEYILPPQTLKVENLVAVVSTSPHVEDATRLVNFLYTEPAQRIWAQSGFRPVLPEVAADFTSEFPTPQTLWTIDDLGGWGYVEDHFFDTTNGLIAQAFEQATQ